MKFKCKLKLFIFFYFFFFFTFSVKSNSFFLKKIIISNDFLIFKKKKKENYDFSFLNTNIFKNFIETFYLLDKNFIFLNRYFFLKIWYYKHQKFNLRFKFKNLYIKNNKRKIKKKINIVIDSGHGGVDPGAIGLNGLKEKDVNLSISIKLFNLINLDKKFNAFLIRNRDVYIPFKERLNIANKLNADLIISIHTDSFLNRKVSGSSVWIFPSKQCKYDIYCNIKIDKLKRNVFINNDLDLLFYVNYNIALEVLNKLKSEFNLKKKYPQCGKLIILSSFTIPSILIETGYISNPNEEKKLGSYVYQNKIAKNIYSGINIFFKKNF